MTLDDRSTRARVRDVAIEVFARDGFGATVRSIAAAADVSPGLVIHHFGSRAGLRAECDARVLAVLTESNDEVLGGSDVYDSFLNRLRDADGAGIHAVYMLRAVAYGGDSARMFVDRMIEQTVATLRIGVEHGQIRPSIDEQGRARYLTMITVGAMLVDTVLHPPPDWSDPVAILRGYIDRVAVPGTELAVYGILTDPAALDAAIAARQYIHEEENNG